MSDTIQSAASLSPGNQTTPAPSAIDRLKACYFYVCGVLAALAAAAVLVATGADAQTTRPAPSAAAAPQQAADAAALPPNTPEPPPRYGASDIKRAFDFMDTNKDGKISREEAAGFGNVAKHFDAADTVKDGALSIAEFDNALNRP